MALTNLKSSSGKKDKSKSSKSKLERKQRKLEKKLQFHAKIKDATESLAAKKTINKKKKLRSRQKKLKPYDLTALAEFLPDLNASQKLADATSTKLNCKSRQKLMQRESMQLRAVLNNPSFQMDPIAAIQRHLELTQPPLEIVKKDVKGKKNKTKAKKKVANGLTSGFPSSMDIQ